MKKFYSFFQPAILIGIVVGAVSFFNFTAEDAYITYRYAENWVDTGSLVYNAGEPINAMTSPLHAMLSSAFYFVTGNTVLSNKIISVVLLFVAALLVWSRYRQHPPVQALALLLLTPASVMLWTFGGLETPFLLFLSTIAVILTLQSASFDIQKVCLIFFVAGLAFLTRYDSVLFFLPLVLYVASKARSLKDVFIASAIAAILPAAWLFVSVSYYGDLLPTSFYVKTPKGHLGDFLFNGIYIASYLVFVGILPAVAFIGALLLPKQETRNALYQHFKSTWWLYAGVLIELMYGLTMATHHMMFSFRFFVPYLPAAVVVVLDLFQRAGEARRSDFTMGRPAYLFTGFLLFLLVFQLSQYIYTYNRSVNGFSFVGEYRSLGIRDYVAFMKILEQEALDIEHHWDENAPASGRSPRILTYAAGVLPYTYRDAYIYEKLVSYRHCYQRHQQALYADYIHILAPRQGEVEEQLPLPEDYYSLVSSYDMFFDGSMQKFLVFYNPSPEGHNLSVGISDFCSENQNSQQED